MINLKKLVESSKSIPEIITSISEGLDNYEEKGKDHWSYKWLTKVGFKLLTPSAKGFRRVFKYKHPNGTEIEATSGGSADRWKVTKGVPGEGYYGSLQDYLKKNF